MDVLRFILRLPFYFAASGGSQSCLSLYSAGFLLRPFTGRIRWAVPGWVTLPVISLPGWSGGNRYPKTISALLLLTAAVAAGSYYTGTGIRTNRSRWMLRRWWCRIFPRLCSALRRLIITVMIIQRRLWW